LPLYQGICQSVARPARLDSWIGALRSAERTVDRARRMLVPGLELMT
jgi:hypothetical protein